jgi:uncharacterized protein (DUF1800 family)
MSGAAAVSQAAEAPGELTEREAAVHVLNRLGYGPRPGDVERVVEMGTLAFIDAQLKPASIQENPQLERWLAEYETLTMPTTQLFLEYPPPQRLQAMARRRGEELDSAEYRMAARKSFTPLAELSQARLARAVHSERQLQEVMVDFWFNHFNVFARKGPVRLFLAEYEREVIRSHALGKFRELLEAVAQSPAMLFYLDNWMSTASDGANVARQTPRRRRGQMPGGPRPGQSKGLNENYARELLELHTLGVDGGYTQDDVVEVARAFTGWTIDLRTGEFVFRADLHDADSKVVLGQEIAGGGSMSDGEQVLDLLARHPSTARFISVKLARRFVSDDPPEPLVERAAAVFTATDGDIEAVVRTIVTSPEFFSREAYRSKVKTPLEWVATGVRGLDVPVRDTRPLVGALNRLDQPLYGAQPPTGYADVAEAWVSSGALLTRAELGQRLARAGSRGPTGRELQKEGTVDGAFDLLLPAVDIGRLRPLLVIEVNEQTQPRMKVETAVSLTLASPEFQRK